MPIPNATNLCANSCKMIPGEAIAAEKRKSFQSNHFGIKSGSSFLFIPEKIYPITTTVNNKDKISIKVKNAIWLKM